MQLIIPADVERIMLVSGSRLGHPIVGVTLLRFFEKCRYFLFEGGAKGADTQARVCAAQNGVKFKTFRAQWKLFGPSAGGERNQEMIDAAIATGLPVDALFFPSCVSVGTLDCLQRAMRAKITTIVYPDREDYL